MQIYGKDGPGMMEKSPQELLQEAESFFKRVGLDERIQQFLETNEAKKTIDEGIDLIKKNINMLRTNVSLVYHKKADKLYQEYMKKEKNMRQDIIDNFKRRFYSMLLLMYTAFDDNDELIKFFSKTIYGIGYAPFMKELQQVCRDVATASATAFMVELY